MGNIHLLAAAATLAHAPAGLPIDLGRPLTPTLLLADTHPIAGGLPSTAGLSGPGSSPAAVKRSPSDFGCAHKDRDATGVV